MMTIGLRERLANEEMEQALLGCLLIDSSRFARVADKVAPEDFWIPANARIFALIGRRFEEGLGADPLVLAPIADADPELESVGGRRYLVDLAGSLVSALNMETYAEEIRELAQRRKMVDVAETICAKVGERVSAKDGDYHQPLLPLGEIMAEAQRGIEGIEADGKRTRTKRQVAEAVVRKMSQPTVCFSTGIKPLDETMGGGLFAGKCYGFEAMDKRGKTTLAGSISHNLNREAVDHAYLAFEMGAEAIEQRNVARDLETNAFRFLRPTDKALRLRAGRYAAEVPEHTIFEDMPGGTFDDLRRVISMLVAKRRIRGFILDGWQLVRGRRPTQAAEEHLREVAQWCADFSLAHGLFSVITGQLNDDGSGFGSRRGMQMACDQVYKLHRDPDEPHGWLEMVATRYTKIGHVGSEDEPALYLDPIGPHYRASDAMEPVDQEGFV